MADERVGVEFVEKGDGTNVLIRKTKELASNMDAAAKEAQDAARANTQLGDSASAAAAKVQNLNAAVGQTTTGLNSLGADNANAIGELTGSTDALNTSLSGVEQSSNVAGTSLDRLKASVTENANYQKEFRSRIADLNTELGTYGSGVREASDATESLGNSAARQPGIFSRIRASLGESYNAFKQFTNGADEAAAGTRRAAEQTDFYDKQLRGGFKDTMQNMIQNLFTLGAAFATIRTVMFTDQVNQSAEALRLYTNGIDANNQKMTELQAISKNTGLGVQDTVSAFVAQARASVGLSEGIGDANINLQNMIAISKMSGTANKDAAASLQEFYAAFPGGIANADALLAVMNKYPNTIGTAVVTALTGATTGTNQFGAASAKTEAIVRQGTVTLGGFFSGVSQQAEKFNSVMREQGVSVGDAFDRMTSSLQSYVANSQNSVGLTGAIASGFNYLADNAWLVVAALTAVTGAIAVIGIAALVSAIGTLVGLFSGFVGILTLATVGITAQAAAVYYAWQAFSDWSQQYVLINTLVELANRYFSALWETLKTVANYVYENVKAFAEWISSLQMVQDIMSKIRGVLDSTGTSFKQVGNSMDSTGVAANGLASGIGTAQRGMAGLYDTTERANGSLTPFVGSLNKAKEGAGGLSSANDNLSSSFGNVKTSADSAASAVSGANQTYVDGMGVVQQYGSALNNLASSFAGVGSAASSASGSVSSFRPSSGGGGGGMGGSSDSGGGSFRPDYTGSQMADAIGGLSQGGSFSIFQGRPSLVSNGVQLTETTGINALYGKSDPWAGQLTTLEDGLTTAFEKFKGAFSDKTEGELRQMYGAPIETGSNTNRMSARGGYANSLSFGALEDKINELNRLTAAEIDRKQKEQDAAKAKTTTSKTQTSTTSNQPRPIQVIINTPDANSFRNSKTQVVQETVRMLQRYAS